LWIPSQPCCRHQDPRYSPNKPKSKKPRDDYSATNLDDYYDGLSDVEWEFAQVIEQDLIILWILPYSTLAADDQAIMLLIN